MIDIRERFLIKGIVVFDSDNNGPHRIHYEHGRKNVMDMFTIFKYLSM